MGYLLLGQPGRKSHHSLHEHGVAEPFGRYQAGKGAFTLYEGVGGNGGTMGKAGRSGQ
jgi:hypothetical protein